MHRLQLFGCPRLVGLKEANARAGQRQRLALLALLAGSRAAGVSRDRLIALLWPEVDTARGRHLLSNSVYILRQALGADVITASGDALRLDSALLPNDVECFLAALEAGDDEAAVACCTAPFMDGFHLPDTAEFDRWLELERDRHARACAAALERLARAAAAAGDQRAAAGWWQRVAESDPYASQPILALMHALVQAGEPGAAVQHARLHERRLREDLEMEPSPEVAEFAAGLAVLKDGAPRSSAASNGSRRKPDAEPSAPAVGSGVVLPALPVAELTVLPVSASIAETPRPARHRWLWQGAAAMAVLLLAAAIARAALPLDSAAPDAVRSIAVLPFVNLSSGSSDDYFSDGLTEELINRLAQVGGLRVVARTSAFAFKGVNRDVRDIGERLNAEVLVEGSVRRTGERLRITVQLVNAADGHHLWSNTYDRHTVADIFQIQDEIARQVVAAVQPRLARVSLPEHGTQNVRALEAYMQGRYRFWQAQEAADLQAAIGHFETAIALDPKYALAYAGIADAYMLLGGPPRTNMEHAKAAARRALELDDDLSEGYVALASINWFYDWDWAAAERNYRRSFSVNRAVYTRCICYVWYLVALGDVDGAVREAQRARALDPAALLPLTTLANVYLASGRFGELRALLPELAAAGVGPFTLAHFQAWLAWHDGRRADALAEMEVLRGGRSPSALAAEAPGLIPRLALMYGRTGEARAMAEALRARAGTGYVDRLSLAAAFAAAGDTAEASRWVRAAVEERANLAYFASSQEAAPLRDLPEFQAALRTVGVPVRP